MHVVFAARSHYDVELYHGCVALMLILCLILTTFDHGWLDEILGAVGKRTNVLHLPHVRLRPTRIGMTRTLVRRSE